MVESEAFPELDPPAGDEVTYQSPFTAVIGDELPAETSDDPERAGFDPGQAPLPPGEGGRNVLVESTVPMAAPEHGDLAPVDGKLDASGDSFTVENAAVEPEIPAELEDGIELGDVETTVTPASTDGAEAVPVADKLFYPSSDTDTDTLVTPTPTGVEIFFQLRSPDAPAANAIDVELPGGASLIATRRRRSRGRRRRRDADHDPAGERLGRGAAPDPRPLRGRRQRAHGRRRDRRRRDAVAGRRRPDHRLLPVGRHRARARTRT